jgi:hypothetical protein
MNRDDSVISPDVNQLIVDKLKSYPPEVSDLALRAIQLSESLPEATVFEALQGHIRDLVRRRGGRI